MFVLVKTMYYRNATLFSRVNLGCTKLREVAIAQCRNLTRLSDSDGWTVTHNEDCSTVKHPDGYTHTVYSVEFVEPL